MCVPTRDGVLSPACSGHGTCVEPGYCSCAVGYAGVLCDEPLDADGARLTLMPSWKVATVNFVWGMHESPTRNLLDGRPVSASLDRSQRLLSESSQQLIVGLCDYLEAAPPWHVRDGSVRCPMARLRQARHASGLAWPMPEDEALEALAELAASSGGAWLNDLVGIEMDPATGRYRAAWLAVEVKASSAPATGGAPRKLLDEAGWFEGVSRAHNAAAAAAGSALTGWQTSAAWIWMEALDEAVGGTAGCILSGALLTAAALILFTGSLPLALATVGGVLVVLVCFVGYLTLRGYELGVIEAIATTIFIGLACDYCVHVLQVHRASGGDLAHTLSHAGPSLFGAAVTTVGSAAPLLFCKVVPFQMLGEFICACTVLSFLVALTLIAPLVTLGTGGGAAGIRAAAHAPRRARDARGIAQTNVVIEGLDGPDEAVSGKGPPRALSEGVVGSHVSEQLSVEDVVDDAETAATVPPPHGAQEQQERIQRAAEWDTSLRALRPSANFGHCRRSSGSL